MSQPEKDVQMEEGRITEEALKVFRSRIGLKLRISHIFNQLACKDTIRHFCDGTGDSNPLYRDPEYAAKTPWMHARSNSFLCL